MTTEDANTLLALAKANYSYAFKNMSEQEKYMLVQSWAFALQDIPVDIVILAFMKLLATSKWLPTVAEIREQIKKLHDEASMHQCYVYLDKAREYVTGSKENIKAEAARKYIIQSTKHLHDSNNPGLTLDTILDNGYSRMLGSEAPKTGNRLIRERE